jgi:hypothetical protein
MNTIPLTSLFTLIVIHFSAAQDSALSAIPVQQDSAVVSDTGSALKTITVATDPESAAVVLDGSVRGYSPLELQVTDSVVHSIELRKKGYYKKTIELRFDTVSTPVLTIPLLKPASIALTSEPAGAQLSMNGKDAGVTPIHISPVKPGDHRIRFQLNGFAAVDTVLSLGNGASDTLHVVMLKKVAPQKDQAKAAEIKTGLTRRIMIITILSLFVAYAAVLVGIEIANVN